MDEQVRVDKWLWAVRIFKTRGLASAAIKKGNVTIGGSTVKPSRNVRIGEIVNVKMNPIVRSYKVLDVSGKRMGAKLVPGFMVEVTAQDQIDLLEMQRLQLYKRDRGAGRPTKKERRDLDNLMDW
ncbi:RNA-binding S4 domain-containing protein [Prolixibacteraceae bacterium JC049]|nr:RNA-binding S4 domain-containing protein [Prolixibacteraceae bacterium JC049]